MVHSAFHIEPVLKKSSYKITALDVWGDRLIIATEQGVLLLLQEQEGAHLVEFEVQEARRNFSKNPVVQMKVGACVTSASDWTCIGTHALVCGARADTTLSPDAH
jgi:hypothetical protein